MKRKSASIGWPIYIYIYIRGSIFSLAAREEMKMTKVCFRSPCCNPSMTKHDSFWLGINTLYLVTAFVLFEERSPWAEFTLVGFCVTNSLASFDSGLQLLLASRRNFHSCSSFNGIVVELGPLYQTQFYEIFVRHLWKFYTNRGPLRYTTCDASSMFLEAEIV